MSWHEMVNLHHVPAWLVLPVLIWYLCFAGQLWFYRHFAQHEVVAATRTDVVESVTELMRVFVLCGLAHSSHLLEPNQMNYLIQVTLYVVLNVFSIRLISKNRAATLADVMGRA